jgi:hypothetical protein
MPEKNKPSLLLTLGAAGLLIGGGVAAYWVLSQQNSLTGDMPVGANIIPQDALLTLSVSTDSDQWQQLREFGTKQTQAELDKNLAQLRDRFLTANGYNYQQDIQPWVGEEVTIAFLAPQSNTPTTKSTPNSPATAVNKQQSVVMVLPIENPAAAKQVLSKPKPLKQGKWVNRTYKGVQIKETQGVPSQNYSATILDQRFLVVTDNPKATQRAIDTYKGGASIAKTAGYTQALDKIKAQERFAQLYVNVPAAARVAATNPARAVSPQGLAQLQNHQGLASTVTLESEGIRFKSISWLKQNSQRVHVVENKAGKMQSRLPAETLMMISAGNLQQLWQDYTQGVKSNPLAPIPPESLRGGIKSLTGQDLDRDLLSWMSGEFSLSVIPAAPTVASKDFALSLLFMVEASDRSRAERSLQQMDKVMSRQYQFQIQKTKVGGQPVVNWISPYGTLTATHGWLDGNVAFLTLGAPIAERIIPQPTTTLASTERFQQTVPSELSSNNGQFFLNVNSTVKSLPLPQFFPRQQIFLEAMRSIGVTSAVSDQRNIRYDLFVSLKKAGEPGSLPSPDPMSATPEPSPTASP